MTEAMRPLGRQMKQDWDKEKEYRLSSSNSTSFTSAFKKSPEAFIGYAIPFFTLKKNFFFSQKMFQRKNY